MWNDTVTVYIDDTSIRLMVSYHKRIKKWADVRLEPGLVKNGVVLKENEVAAQIKKLVLTQEVKTKKIILGYSGLHSLTRPLSLPPLPKSMLPEAVAREARRVLPVPLEQLYLTWRVMPSSKGKTQVFVAATPRKSSDSLIKAVRAGGLEPYRMAIKPLVLTKALTVNDAMLIDLQPGEFDIVIMMNGIAQPIRTVSLPNEDLTWEKKIEMITSDLERTIKFYDSNNPESPLTPEVPLFISGDLLTRPELHQPLAEQLGHPVKILSFEMTGTQAIEQRHLINIAMAIAAAPAGREVNFQLSNLNVLPAPYCTRSLSWPKMVGIPGGAAVCGLVVPLLLMMQSSASNIESLQKELDATNLEVNKKTVLRQELKTTVTDLETQLAAVKLNYDNIQLSLDDMRIQQGIINGDLNAVLSGAPSSVFLKDIRESEGNVIIAGKAPQEADVLAYARTLDNTMRFASTTVSELNFFPGEEKQESYVEFTLTMRRDK
jgi:type IV pilus assembly protein PilM